MASPVENVLSRLQNVQRVGAGWQANCPAHDSHGCSLKIDAGEDERALLNCFGNGCSATDICKAIGLQLSDLMPSSNGHAAGNGRARKPRKTYQTAREAVESLTGRMGPYSQRWTYEDAEGRPCGLVLRWDSADGKTFRPVSRAADGRWYVGAMEAPRPLYGLGLLGTAQRVFVCEGEKCVDALRSIGLVAVTSSGGSKAGHLSDWSPLAGREVWIWPDYDEPGAAYANAVGALLEAQGCVVKLLEVPDDTANGLPEGWDAADWLDAHDAVEPAALREAIEGFGDTNATSPEGSRNTVATTSQWAPFPIDVLPEELGRLVDINAKKQQGKSSSVSTPLRWKLFPVDLFPPPLDRFVADAAAAIGCDRSYVGGPQLAALAAAIGNARGIELKAGHVEPSILWCLVAAEPNTGKSPAIDAVTEPLLIREQQAGRDYKAEVLQYEALKEQYDMERRGRKKSDDLPTKPLEPIPLRYVCNDTTVEAVACLQQDQPRGILLAKDELGAWLGSFDQYTNAKGVDASKWCECYGGRFMVVDRKGHRRDPIRVDHASVSIAGGIQPGPLMRSMTSANCESGLIARMFVAYPPQRPQRYTEATLSRRRREELREVFSGLMALELKEGPHGGLVSVPVPVTPAAKQLYIDHFNTNAEEWGKMTGNLRWALGKLGPGAARIALVLHLARGDGGPVDDSSMSAGIAMANWFRNEAKRLDQMVGGTNEDRDLLELVGVVESNNGTMNVRDLQRGSRKYRTSQDAERALMELVSGGYGTWEPPKPGNRSRVFSLRRGVDSDSTTQNPGENMGTVDTRLSAGTPSGGQGGPAYGGDGRIGQENGRSASISQPPVDSTSKNPEENGTTVSVDGVEDTAHTLSDDIPF